MKTGEDLLTKLLQADGYREFLSAMIKTESRLSYSALARRAGFSSRSYPREVVTGRRRITAKTLPQFIKGLRLKGDLKSYFSLLVIQSEPELNVQGLSEAEIRGKLSRLRERMQTSQELGVKEKANRFLKSEAILEIYAALGSREVGHSLEEIVQLTGLKEEVCRTHLRQMCKEGLVEFKSPTGTFAPTVMHLSFEGLGGQDFFKKYYLESSRKMSQRARTQFESERSLYFSSVFSIRSQKAVQFKSELRKLILQFIDEAEDAHGDQLARIVLGFEG